MENNENSEEIVVSKDKASLRTINNCIDALSQDIRDFCLPINLEVPEIPFDTKEQAANYCPLEFHRNWVSQNRPVIFRGAVKHWPAFKLWQSNEYFRKKLRDNLVTVSITPNGYADAALPLHDDSFNDKNSKFQFVMPHEEQITVEKFLDILEASPGKDEAPIPWIVTDPLQPDYVRFPNFRKTSPLHLRLNAGDLLYLPSLWFHHLRQSHGCVAVNFWYDMDYGPLFAHQNFLKNILDVAVP